MADEGTTLLQTDAPTFAEFIVNDDTPWVERDTREVQEIQSAGVLKNANVTDDAQLEVTVDVHPVTTALAVLDVVTETNGSLRKWIVIAAETGLGPRPARQTVTLRYGAGIQASI